MASWKKVLTEGDDTNVGNTNQEIDSGTTRTVVLNSTGSTPSTSVFKIGYGSPFKNMLSFTETNGVVSTLDFNATVFNVNSSLQLRGLVPSIMSGEQLFFEASNNGSNYLGLKAPLNIPTTGTTTYTLPLRPESTNAFLVSGTASSTPDMLWANEVTWDESNQEVCLTDALINSKGAAGGRSGTLLDVTEVDDASGKCIGDFVNLDGLASATFATNRVFAFTGSGAPLADADNESDATRMLLFNNIAQSTSTTLKALRKGMAIIPEADVEGTAAAGAIMYLHPSGGTAGDEGKMTFTRPTASGKFVRHVGYCIKTVTISTVDYVVFLFDPSSDFIKLG